MIDYSMLSKNGRIYAFKEEGVHLLSMHIDVHERGTNWYYFEFEGHKYDYYPKTDKLHKHKGNVWMRDGFEWIQNNIFTQEI